MKSKIYLTKTLAALVVCASLGACASNPHHGQYSNNSNCRNGTNYAAAALGAIAGGLVGSQIGGGLGTSVAIAAGAGAGAMIGNNAGCN